MERHRTFQARQGDVFLQRVLPREPSGTLVSNQGRVILAFGEVSGHMHEVIDADRGSDEGPAARLFLEPDGTRYLFVDRCCLLRHDEHDPIVLAPSVYEVILQREYEPTGLRNALD